MPRPDDARRSCCPVACTLDLLGDRWTLLIVRDLMAGRTRFTEFQRSPEGIATNILASRLDALVEHGLVEQRIAPSGRRRTYHLTPRGESLRPILESLRDWGLDHIGGTNARIVAASTD